MKKIIILSIFCALLVPTKSFGQAESYFSMQYSVSFGTGDLQDYISKASWRGITMDYRSAVTSNVLVGLEGGWNVFYERKDHDVYTDGTVSLSGVQYRYQNAVPLLATLDYMISTGTALKPYVGLGIGTLYSGRSTDMNLYRLQQNSWQFALKGELGLLYEVSYNTAVKFAAKYHNGFKTNKLENQGYISLNLGLAWDIH